MNLYKIKVYMNILPIELTFIDENDMVRKMTISEGCSKQGKDLEEIIKKTGRIWVYRE